VITVPGIIKSIKYTHGVQQGGMSYVLITAVHNEEKYIHYPLESVLSQTCIPLKWVIVSDGSTDGTDNVLRKYEGKHPFLHWCRLEKDSKNKGFLSKVHALRYAYELVNKENYNYIGILDGDVSFCDTYYRNIMGEFNKNPKLGIAGGFVHERDRNGIFQSRIHNRERSVPGAVQMFRRECYERIGGLKPIVYGGEDAYAEIEARAAGWEVRSFPEYPVFHHKPGHLKRGIWKERIREGKMDYAIGNHPFFELMKFLRRIPEYPVFIGAAVRMLGYLDALVMREDRIPPTEMLKQIKAEQWDIMRKAFQKTLN
jgi:glycosyltransferase involved in cell wall biosynthesis